MELIRVDTQQAYEQIRERIITLALAPGAAINPQALAGELDLGLTAVQEALKLLVHDDLVVVTPRHGLYVADVTLTDLEQISETRLSLEPLCARLAAQRATADDLAVLDALCAAQKGIDGGDGRSLFDLDHKFHQAIAQAAHNKYLARTLEHFFGLSQRLWYLALPHLDFLATAVDEHLNLVTAVRDKDADRAAQIMHDHVQDFYDKVRQILSD
ncbi:MAG: GntR family transcriptional regulator [Ardenticatenaceae bacterium]|nr:GntR family transcriptional regulator [Ardenticatenaceae bacterium]MCB9442905.1 GntR family transcriptional regulator [Ardenticatenaceae bacterium]